MKIKTLMPLIWVFGLPGLTGFTGLTGCANEPTLQHESATANVEPCTGREASCKSLAAQMNIDASTAATKDKAARKLHAHSIYGRCEIIVSDGKAAPGTYPCTEVKLVLRKGSGEERMTWLQGFDFEIPELTSGSYTLNAYSDQFGAGAEKTKIKPGQAVVIQMKLSPPGTTTQQ